MVGKEVDVCGGRRCYCERGMWGVEVDIEDGIWGSR